MVDFKAMANKIWSVADLLRGDYKQSDYGKIILPMTVLRRPLRSLDAIKADILKLEEETLELEQQVLL